MAIVPNIHLAGQCKAAIGLYKRALGAEVHGVWDYPDDGEYGPECEGLVYHAELSIGGARVVMNDGLNPVAPAGNTVSLMLTLEGVEEARRTYQALLEGATVITPPCETGYSHFFASLIDMYGVRWELIVEK